MHRKFTLEEFINKAKIIHSTRYDYTSVLYTGMKNPIQILCKRCGLLFFQRPDHHLCGRGCPRCSIKIQASKHRLTIKEFIGRAKKIHGNKYDYSKAIYLGHKSKIKIFCKNCLCFFKQTANAHLRGEGCPHCNIVSKGEQTIKEWLNKHKIKYISQKRFKNCRDKLPLSFDFYLPDYKLCIEFQGQQHYEPSMQINLCKDQQKGLLKFKLQQKHDKIKKEYCLQNNLFLLEIKHTDNIKDKLKEGIKNV